MLHQRFLIQNDSEQKINYDRSNQVSCSNLINNFTMRVKDNEQKINYEWPQFLESTLWFKSTPTQVPSGYIS